ncbi:MAG: hypothetical protein Q8L81_16605 [Bacteroidota bacterium]|nr:hypothetical protein [Bacteroidota bacterium]
MITKDNFEKAKAAYAGLQTIDGLDAEDAIKKLQNYFDNYFGTALIATEGDYKHYLLEDIKDLKNRKEEMIEDEKEQEYILARVESSLDLYGQIITDTERELSAID